MVGLSGNKVFCVVCKAPDSYPLVMPKPVLMLLDLRLPLACSDLGADDLENEFIIRNLHLSQIQQKIKENAKAVLDTSSLDDEAFDMETAIDRCILRLIASCCNGDKLVRATELARLLSMEKSINGAIKLVTILKLPILAERFNDILEERLLNEVKGCVSSPFGITDNVPLSINLPAMETCKEKNEERDDTKRGTEECKKSTKPLEKEGGNVVKMSNDHERSEAKAKKPIGNQFNRNIADGSSKESGRHLPVTGGGTTNSDSNSIEVAKQKLFQRPTNPFAKSSKNLEKPSSLLDSIKKMKKADK